MTPDLLKDLEDHLFDHDPVLIVMVGPSGAGKSTIARNLPHPKFNEDSVVSSDSFREQITGDPLDLSEDKKMWKAVYETIALRMHHGLKTVLDATNMNQRRWDMALACTHGSERVTFLVVDRPLEDKRKTAGWRGDKVIMGEPLIDHFHRRMKRTGEEVFKMDGKRGGRIKVFDLREE